jgi:hypothetical protein
MRPRIHDTGLPSSVYLRRGTYYFVTSKRRWIRLGKTEEQMWRNLPQARREPKTREEAQSYNRLLDHLKKIHSACQTRAKKNGIEFSLSFDDAANLLANGKFRCAITGAKFSFDRYGNTLKRPFVPSIDRIDSSKGYTMDNCRVVCSITNIAMNAWGEKPLLTIIQAGAKRYIDKRLAQLSIDVSPESAP